MQITYRYASGKGESKKESVHGSFSLSFSLFSLFGRLLMRAGFSKQQPFFRVRQARGGTSQQEMRGLVLIHRNVGLYELPAPADHVVERLNACRVLCGRLLTPRGDEPPDMQGRVVSNRGIRFTGRMSVIVDFALYAFDADLAQQVEPPLPSGTPRSKPPA